MISCETAMPDDKNRFERDAIRAFKKIKAALKPMLNAPGLDGEGMSAVIVGAIAASTFVYVCAAGSELDRQASKDALAQLTAEYIDQYADELQSRTRRMLN